MMENLKIQLFAVCDKEEKRLQEETKKYIENIKAHICAACDNVHQNSNQDQHNTSTKLEHSPFPSMIKLNVGGRMFATSLATLTSHPDSYFGAMFSKQWNSKPAGEDGSYFIDKNPQVFHIILDYLRGEELDLELTPSEKRALLRDAQFYQLPDLVDILNKPLNPPKETNILWELNPSPYGTLSNNNRTFQKNQGGALVSFTVLGTVGWSSGVHQWSVVLVNNFADVMVGVAPFNTEPTHFSKGFYLYSVSGTLYGPDGTSNKAYCQPRTAARTKITVILDMDGKTLTFIINGAWQPVAWSNLPSVTFYPAFNVGTQNAIFTAVPE